MELVSGPLTGAQILAEIPAIRNLFTLLGEQSLLIEHGWGSKLKTDDLWNDIRVNVADLTTKVQESVEAGVFRPGSADLIIQNGSRTVIVRLCHESDIHVTTNNETILKEVVIRWISNGYGGFESDVDGAWRPIGR